MANCLSAFGPSRTLHKYLLKYVSDHAPTDGFRAICQHKLLRSGKLESSTMSRTYPPTLLEWRANKKRVNMALPAVCCDNPNSAGNSRLYHAAVDSYSTCEEFASAILHVRPLLHGEEIVLWERCDLYLCVNQDRGVAELNGWSVSIEEGDTCVELNGGDFILDGLGEMELPPAFPVKAGTPPPFVVTTDR